MGDTGIVRPFRYFYYANLHACSIRTFKATGRRKTSAREEIVFTFPARSADLAMEYSFAGSGLARATSLAL